MQVSFAFCVLIILLILPLTIISLVDNLVNIKTEATTSRFGQKIVQDPIFRYNDIIASNNAPPSPLIIIPPTSPISNHADIIRSDPLLQLR